MEPFVAKDVLEFRLIKDIRVRPGGREVAYEVRSIDREHDTYGSEIWAVPTDGSAPTRLTPGRGLDTMPRWSPDGTKLAFASDDDSDAPQLHVLDRESGSLRRLTDFEGGVSSIAWAPDGSRLLVGVTVATDEGKTGREPRPQVVRRQRYKSDGAGFLLHGRSQAFVIPLDGDPIAITEGDADTTGGAWSPDGGRIAFCRSREGVREGHLTDVWIAAADGSASRRLTRDIPSAASPAWSPDGRSIVFIGAREAGDSMQQLWIADVESGEVRPLAKEFSEVASYPLMRSNPPQFVGDSVFFLRGDRGRSEIAAARVAERTIETVVGGDRQITVFHLEGECLAYVAVSVEDPGDVCVRSLDGADERRLTALNDDWWNRRCVPKAELRRFATRDGGEIEGWLIRPRNEPPEGAPLFVDVHGGPHSFAEFGFPYHAYWYVLCSRGWAVLALNPVGSSSYGPAFARQLRGKWGELDLPQHLDAIRQLQAEKVVGDRIAIGGKSYGGYLAAWAIGHTDVFSAAVISAPVGDLVSHFGTSDSGYYVGPYDMNADVTENPELFRRLSPLTDIHRSTTPALILQGTDDQRCPVGQAEQLFAALMQADRSAVEMVLYPGGHHDLAEDGRPSHRVHYHGAIVDWVERWCGADSETG
jgi:dipeptidyl aminopeptidase/acylaminoacyl peptidase